MVHSRDVYFFPEFTSFSCSDTLSFYLSNLFSHVVSIFFPSRSKLYERYILIMSKEKETWFCFSMEIYFFPILFSLEKFAAYCKTIL